jgi:hypothetical protein
MLDSKTLSNITAQICRRFPEVSGSQPKVRLQPVPKSTAGGKLEQYLLTFRGVAKTGSGQSISRSVRVVVSAQGKILKVTTSHG